MDSILDKIVKRLHLFFIVFAGMSLYSDYEDFERRIKTANDDKANAERKQIRLKKDIKNLKSYFSDIEKAKENIEEVALRVEKLQKQLPSTSSDTENQALIKDISSKLNLKKTSVKPVREENKGFYFVKDYSFEGEGTFLQFLIFFEKIAQSERLLNVKELSFSSPSYEQKGRFQIILAKATIEAYRYNENHTVDRGIEKIEQEFKAPKAPARRKRR